MKNRKLKKGFTLVELIVVIAIVAILAAVSVVSYIAFIRQANESADIQLVKQLNTALQGDETLNGPRSTMHEMLGAMEDNGFVVENLTKTKSGYDIVWDQEHNRFALLDNDKVVYGEDSYSKAAEYNVWKFADNVAEAERKHYSIYLTKDFDKTNETSLTIYAGLDVGGCAKLSEINYENNGISAKKQEVVINTNTTKTTVNFDAPKDTINWHGIAGLINVNEVGKDCLNVYGNASLIQQKDTTYSAVIFKNGCNVGMYYVGENADVDHLSITVDSNAIVNFWGASTDEIASAVKTMVPNATVATLSSDELNNFEKTASSFGGGNGTEKYPHLIATYEQFANINFYSDVANVSSSKDKHFRLIADITVSSPLGDGHIAPLNTGNGYEHVADKSFEGIFDGNNHTISYQYIAPNSLAESKSVVVGLFGAIDNATIQNLVVDCDVDTTAVAVWTSGLCSSISGNSTIKNVEVKGEIKANSDVSGFAVYAAGSENGEYISNFINCKMNADIINYDGRRDSSTYVHIAGYLCQIDHEAAAKYTVNFDNCESNGSLSVLKTGTRDVSNYNTIAGAYVGQLHDKCYLTISKNCTANTIISSALNNYSGDFYTCWYEGCEFEALKYAGTIVNTASDAFNFKGKYITHNNYKISN